MEHIVFLDRAALWAEVRRPAFAHVWEEYPNSAPEDVASRLQEATIAIVNKVALTADILNRLPKLKFVAVSATGVNNVDLEACRARGIPVSNIRGYAVNTVPEHVMMLLLALQRNVLAYRADVEQGLWQASNNFCHYSHPIRDLHDSTLGIIGYGALAQSVEKLASAFGMRILIAEHRGAASIRPGRTDFETVLRESDAITLHAPLNNETRGLIGRRELQTMKPSAVIINTGRGGLVDEAALAEALRDGTIGGAGFDVLSLEPPREGNPLLEIRQPNFILTPHVAWASSGAMQALADQLIDNVEAFARGEPRNRVV